MARTGAKRSKKSNSKPAPFGGPNPKGMRRPLSLYEGCPPAGDELDKDKIEEKSPPSKTEDGAPGA
jgi:hypothetical protein